MFNNTRYSLARYSLNLETRTIEVVESFAEAVKCVAGVAIPVEVRERYADTVQGYTRGTISVMSNMAADEALSSLSTMSANIIVRATAAETLAAAVEGKKDVSAALTSADSLAASARGSKDTPATLGAYEALTASAVGSKDIYIAVVVADTLTAIMEATSQTTEIAVVQVTIPPGGELRLDSENFSAMLNGENVLHAQSGDWINISRELLRLLVESSTGGALEGQLIYTERYL